jgi:CRP-like cAMP-binding protein
MVRYKTDFRKVGLQKIPVLRFVSSDTLKKIEANCVRVNFVKGQEIIERASNNEDVYILLSGCARVTILSASGKAVNFRRINPGDIFGEFAAIDGQKRSANVEAAKSCTVLCIPGQLFRELMATDRNFLTVVLNHLVVLLRSLTARILEFSTLAVKNRIHCEVLRMAKFAMNRNGECQITPAPTHSEIAARISTHREAVSREFSHMRELGLIERQGRTLVVKDLLRLEQMVQDALGGDWADDYFVG